MQRLPRIWRAAAALAVLLVCAAYAPGSGAPNGAGTASADDATVVLVQLNLPPASGSAAQRSLRRAQIAAGQDGVLAAVTDARVIHRFDALPAIAVRASAAAIQRLKSQPLVASVTPDRTVYASLVETAALIHATVPRDVDGITGSGVTVAVLDTGLDTDHPDLASDIAYQQCYSVTATCPGGTTSASGPGAAEDGNGHGTNVAGIITSSGTVAPKGIAPDAKIAAYRVLAPNGSGSTLDIVSALDDILNNHPEVREVNMSLSDNVDYMSACDTLDPVTSTAVNALRAQGTLTFAAAGNSGFTNGIGWPACLANVVSVGAVWDATLPNITFGGCTQAPALVDTVTCFSNSSLDLDLLAPGAFLTSTGLAGGTSEYGGTSQASPVAAAVGAMLWQANPAATPAQVEATLKACGKPVKDTRNSITRNRVDAAASITEIAAPDADGDGISGCIDNCPALANPSQANTGDGEVHANGPMLAGDDVTWPMSDLVGDACDPDDDNDGLTDAAETSGSACAGIITNPLMVDTDGDHLTDGWECTHGSNPTDASSKALGTPSATDADGDHIVDLWEQRGYNASGSSTDSDADGCADLVETASVDGNKTVNDTDRLAVARRVLNIWAPEAAQDYVFDMDKNGTLADPDRLFVARAALLPDWLPKSCP